VNCLLEFLFIQKLKYQKNQFSAQRSHFSSNPNASKTSQMKETPTDPSLPAKPLQIEFPIPKITTLNPTKPHTNTYIYPQIHNIERERERERDLFVSSCT
jgi:hypothetical protein